MSHHTMQKCGSTTSKFHMLAYSSQNLIVNSLSLTNFLWMIKNLEFSNTFTYHIFTLYTMCSTLYTPHAILQACVMGLLS